MPLNLASPGIVVREVDLTIGRVDPVSGSIGALVAPFTKGPVDLPQLIESEDDLLNTFGRPYSTDKHYEHWLVASSYLAYGGVMLVSRADDYNVSTGAGLKNAYVGAANSVRIKSTEHYEQLGYDENAITNVTVAARNPGSWANDVKVAIIDSKADQILSGLSTTSVATFTTSQSAAGTVGAASSFITGITTSGINANDAIKAITNVVGAGVSVVSVGVGSITMSANSLNSTSSSQTFEFGSRGTSGINLTIGDGVKVDVPANATVAGSGSTSVLTGTFRGIISEIGVDQIGVKFVGHVSTGNTFTAVDYQQNGVYAFPESGTATITAPAGSEVGTVAYTREQDWFENQVIPLSVGELEWDQLADRPGTSDYAAARGGRFDEVHVVVIDDKGTITGNAGTILEKHLNLSKASDATFSVGSPSYWRKYIYTNSEYIFGGSEPVGVTTIAFGNSPLTYELDDDGGWDQDAKNVNFNGVGAFTGTLGGGTNYASTAGADTTDYTTEGSLTSGLDDIVSGLTKFENTEEYEVDFILMGSANYSKEQGQALANKCIAVAEARKDAVAFISPYRGAFISDNEVGSVTVNDIDTITNNVLSFYSSATSTTYGIFDSGYKYMYDRFNDTFRYVPLNGDIAGTCARTDIEQFPWFSPAGTSRGAILNAVKLAYNPGKKQRDLLYSSRINPVILSPGAGIILFGDKTGFGKSSAFDRINVRRLFIYLEDAISAAAKDFLFEFNDEITRTNFVNIVEPFLRDVQSKRGIQDFVVVCDETNNTAAVIDANEFIADIFIKPARSINFIGLTFVATRTGVAFEEVIGTV
jgi:hypothetical protein